MPKSIYIIIIILIIMYEGGTYMTNSDVVVLKATLEMFIKLLKEDDKEKALEYLEEFIKSL